MTVEGVRSMPCEACPYRCDVPSGVWSAGEYEKLVEYDQETWAQPQAYFACHATPDWMCHGWAVVHGENLLALRLAARMFGVNVEIPEAGVPMFASGAEAAAHGMRDIENPSDEAREAVERLMRKHPRLLTDAEYSRCSQS